MWAGNDFPSSGDKDVLERAETDGRILFTLDRDFWQIAIQRRERMRKGGVVLIRVHPATAGNVRKACRHGFDQRRFTGWPGCTYYAVGYRCSSGGTERSRSHPRIEPTHLQPPQTIQDRSNRVSARILISEVPRQGKRHCGPEPTWIEESIQLPRTPFGNSGQKVTVGGR